MLWADKIADRIQEQYKEKIAEGKPLIVRDEKTASGRVHVGSLRGVAIHGVISEVLSERGIANQYLFEINDFDPMDGMPVYLDKETFTPYMGKPLCMVPSPDGKAANYAEYYGGEFMTVIRVLGFSPTFYRSSELYRAGKFDEYIIAALNNADTIREIYKRVSGSTKNADWYPVNIMCEQCGSISNTKVVSWDGTLAEYECRDIEWAKGCGHKGKVSPTGGKAKLPWKVEWAAKWKVLGVDVEGAGKDHSTKGGAREVSETISREVFNHIPPFDIPYEFFHVEGKKMSSSGGRGSSSREMADLLPAPLLRLLLLQKEPQRVIDFVPDGDTVPVIFDNYDSAAEAYWKKAGDNAARLFELIHSPEERKKLVKITPARFGTLAFLVQMPHLDPVAEIEKIQGVTFGEADIADLKMRAGYAKKWLELYAPDDYKFEIQEILPESAKSFNEMQKEALREVLQYVKAHDKIDGQEFHTKLHDIKKEKNIDPKQFFSAIYLSVLGKENGPKAGWFLSVLDKKFLEKRLSEVI